MADIERIYGPREDRIDTSQGPARGVLLGVVLGLAFWAGVLAIAYAITVLA